VVKQIGSTEFAKDATESLGVDGDDAEYREE